MKIGAGMTNWTKNYFLRLHLNWFSQYSIILIFHYSIDELCCDQYWRLDKKMEPSPTSKACPDFRGP
ncbi:MAG: hypothetical protein Q7V12_05305, partial [Deltaproteobacteria bacterium]|nr:hypothetical protein [Deltaproteobacteria bacterium]